MTRPTLEAINMLDSEWTNKINNNFEKLYDGPFPSPLLTENEGGGGVEEWTPVVGPSASEGPDYHFSRTTGDRDYNAYITSSVSKTGECFVSFTIPDPIVGNDMDRVLFGVSFGSTPTPNNGWGDIDYFWRMYAAGYGIVYDGSSSVTGASYYSPGDVISISYSGTSLTFQRNEIVWHTIVVSAGLDIYLDVQLYETGNVIESTLFQDTAPGPGGGVTFAEDARLFQNCIGVYEGVLYQSDGTDWTPLDFDILDFVADLDTGSATVSEIKDAYNALLADLQAKGWMT